MSKMNRHFMLQLAVQMAIVLPRVDQFHEIIRTVYDRKEYNLYVNKD
jgi:hypothetical protein